MASNYNHPSIKIQVGNEIVGDGDAYLKLTGTVSANAASEQKAKLAELCNELQIDKSVIIVLSSESYDATELKDFIEEALKKKEGELKDIAYAIEDGKVSVKVEQNNGKVFIQVKPGQEFEEMIWGSFQMVLDSGLQDLCNEQENGFELSIKSNKGFQTLMEDFEKMEQGIGANALEQVGANIALHLDKNLVDSVMGIIKNFDPELAQIPPLLLLSYFKCFTVDVKFSSPSELPEEFKKYFLTPKKYYESAEEKEAKNIPEIALKFMELVGGEAQVYATVENLAAFKLELKGNYFSKFLQKFGGLLKK